MIEIAPGAATLGQKRGEFGWDNEFDEHSGKCARLPHRASTKLRTASISILCVKARQPPHFWTQRGESFIYRGMFSEIPLPLNAPVYVTHAEATAYARWAGKQLPTEAQFHRAAYETPDGSERPYPWGSAPARCSPGQF